MWKGLSLNGKKSVYKTFFKLGLILLREKLIFFRRNERISDLRRNIFDFIF